MRTKKTVAVLISGLAGSGKTTVQGLLAPRLAKIEGIELFTYSFADPIKYIAVSFIGWDGKKDDAGRELLQDLGKDGRKYDESIWVKHLITQISRQSEFPPHFVVVDDWRFPNEAEHLLQNPLYDVYTVRITGRGGVLKEELSKDESETSLTDSGKYDMIIDNSGDLEALEAQVENLSRAIQEKFIVE